MEDLIVLVTLIAIGYFTGRYFEARHYRSIMEREERYRQLPIVTMEEMEEEGREIQFARLASGSVVISIDYFKRFLSSLQKLFGGNVTAYQTLVDRARREALLRMIETARHADIIENVRIETSAIGQSANRKNSVGSVEALAYGTAIKYKRDDTPIYPEEVKP